LFDYFKHSSFQFFDWGLDTSGTASMDDPAVGQRSEALDRTAFEEIAEGMIMAGHEQVAARRAVEHPMTTPSWSELRGAIDESYSVREAREKQIPFTSISTIDLRILGTLCEVMLDIRRSTEPMQACTRKGRERLVTKCGVVPQGFEFQNHFYMI
jgi:hypothetical protein